MSLSNLGWYEIEVRTSRKFAARLGSRLGSDLSSLEFNSKITAVLMEGKKPKKKVKPVVIKYNDKNSILRNVNRNLKLAKYLF